MDGVSPELVDCALGETGTVSGWVSRLPSESIDRRSTGSISAAGIFRGVENCPVRFVTSETPNSVPTARPQMLDDMDVLFECKLMNIYLNVKYIRRCLESNEYTIFPDHNPSNCAHKSSSDKFKLSHSVLHLPHEIDFVAMTAEKNRTGLVVSSSWTFCLTADAGTIFCDVLTRLDLLFMPASMH
ncbi:unnamed protein product [Schistocephalus solidus]|uniref:Uncharacterized protein n=1 Tax=Schistocephalus solidus TaxID=70667 RepID=A0A183ST14_SCHSO|nr:unnamed protein product [Schistocephalus solidus]